MLYIVATPIGNREDITLRALRVLREADYILVEDTRKSGLLLKRFNINKRLVSFYEHNERKKMPQVVDDLQAGKNIALVCNAGTPTISDPGYRLVLECRQRKLEITALPGPCSIVNALALSSIPHEQFMFRGYLPRKSGARRRLLETLRALDTTFVFLESPYRLIASLQDLLAIFGNRRVTVAREMTKRFEEVFEAELEEALAYFGSKKIKGEIALIVENRKAVSTS